MVARFNCPYCGREGSTSNTGIGFVVCHCYPDEGGCDQPFALKIEIETKVHVSVRKIEGFDVVSQNQLEK